MFQDFAKKKFNDYIALLEFPAGRISFNQLRTSTLPPFIINFYELYIPNKSEPLNKKDFEEILRKAIIFNINYIIKPRNTILKFLFGDVETRPVSFIKERLKYFQFYGYYITQISDFISINSLEFISVNQAEHLITDINKKLMEEISLPGGESARMNLVKLLYYFFHDLGENNPINIKIPKKILSAFFHDKGYYEIKKRVDGFFSDEIFIQEALELMNPETKKSSAPKSDVGVSEDKVKEIVTKAKTRLIDAVESTREAEKILPAEEDLVIEIRHVDPAELRKEEESKPKKEKATLVVDEDLYSDDLVFASHFSDITPNKPKKELTEDEAREELIQDLFCEESYRKKIIKNIFKKNPEYFITEVNRLLDAGSWEKAAVILEELYAKNRVNYYSDAAVRFVDILQGHFMKNEPQEN